LAGGLEHDYTVTGSMRFPFNNFRHFSLSFQNSFAIGLSYLALDEIYFHLFRAAFPNNSTREKADTIEMTDGIAYGILTLYDASFQKTYILVHHSGDYRSKNYNSTRQNPVDFKFELYPLHSPLLRVSLLVSFPPVSNMLKFTGYPYLN